jgi:hypothetical protein
MSVVIVRSCAVNVKIRAENTWHPDRKSPAKHQLQTWNFASVAIEYSTPIPSRPFARGGFD